MGHPTYSIVLPAYNESVRIAATIDAVSPISQPAALEAEVIVVNDGSTRQYRQIVGSAPSAIESRAELLKIPETAAKDTVSVTECCRPQGEILLFSDADLSSPIEEAEKLFAAIAGGADVAIGSRWLKTELQTRRQPFYRQLLGRIFNLALRLILGLQFKDTQCGFKAFTRRAAHALFPLQKIERWGFDPELLLSGKTASFAG